jgi:uncharacterized protein YehS (DUF1456 family)
MTNNDIIRSVRYLLNLSDAKIAEIVGLAGLKISVDDVKAYLAKEEDPAYHNCNDEVMVHFLDGLIYFKRGRDPHRAPLPFELPVTNNLVLKKMRVAFELREDDVLTLVDVGGSGYNLSKAELNAFFRKSDHPNYRPCGDQVLRFFLKGLTQRLRGQQ